MDRLPTSLRSAAYYGCVGTTTFRRPPRLPAPEYPSGEVVLETPPELAQPGRNWARMMMMLPMLAGARR